MCERGSMIDARRGVVIIASARVNYNMYARTTVQLIENRQCRVFIIIPGLQYRLHILNIMYEETYVLNYLRNYIQRILKVFVKSKLVSG